MVDKRKHRGQHPQDKKLFSKKQIPKILQAVRDFSLLLTKDYPPKSSLKLVGDKFNLTKRQRLAVMRCACSDQELKQRTKKCTHLEDIKSGIMIDGYNLLITVESALSGGLIFIARDRSYRDLASIHGSYKKVNETIPALELIGNFLQKKNISKANWFVDSPVSNSGRLKTIMLETADENSWQWSVELMYNPDRKLIDSNIPVATSDSLILDNCRKWVNLAGEIIKAEIPESNIIDLTDKKEAEA